jgi:predicted small lipoprotein YifL
MKAGLSGCVAAVFVLSLAGCPKQAPLESLAPAMFWVTFDAQGCPTRAQVDAPNCENHRPDCLALKERSTRTVHVTAEPPATGREFTIEVTPAGLGFDPNGPPDKPRSSYAVRVGAAPPGEYKFSIVAGPCRLDPTIIIVPH